MAKMEKNAQSPGNRVQTVSPLACLSLVKPTLFASGTTVSEKEIHQVPGYFQGWRMGVPLCAVTTESLVINLAIMTWVAAGPLLGIAVMEAWESYSKEAARRPSI